MSTPLAPVGLLPKTQRNYVLENSWSDVADRYMVEHLGAIASHLAGSCIQVQHPEGRVTPGNTHTLIVGPPNSGKTEAGRKLHDFYRQLVREYSQNRSEELKACNEAMSSYHARFSGIEKRIKSIEAQVDLSDDERNERLDAALRRRIELIAEKPVEPPTSPEQGSEATFAGIKKSVNVHPNLMLNVDEGPAFFGALDKRMVAIINSSYSGVSHKSLAANNSGDPITPILTSSVLIQRTPFNAFVRSDMGKHCIGSGFFDRFGFSYVDFDDLKDGRQHEIPDTDTASQACFERMRYFFDESVRFGKIGYESRPTLRLSRRAAHAVDNARRCVQTIVSDNAPFFDESTYPGRSIERMVRMAATDHAFEGAEGDITCEEIENAFERVMWHIENYRLLFAETDKRYQYKEDAEYVADLLARRGRSLPKTQMSSIELELSMSNLKVRNAISYLIKHGRLKQVEKLGDVHFQLTRDSRRYERVLVRGGI